VPTMMIKGLRAVKLLSPFFYLKHSVFKFFQSSLLLTHEIKHAINRLPPLYPARIGWDGFLKTLSASPTFL